VISSTKYNNVINDIATGLSLCLTKDGQQVATANIPFGGFRATNVGITAVAGSVGTPAINVSDAATGLYRSAVSELAVSIAGVQRARFDATGLVIPAGTGITVPTLTATTSVVTPQITTPAATNLVLNPTGNAVVSNADNTQQLGLASNRWALLYTPIIDSGTTGPLSLKTNNGAEQFRVVHSATAVNFVAVTGAPTGAAVKVFYAGGDANVGVQHLSFGTGVHSYFTGTTDLTGAGAVQQFQILHTATANRNITITGSNGGNPTISTTAGSLAITPAVVIAGASLQVGTTPASTAAVIGIPYGLYIGSRNSANNADLALILGVTRNAVVDVIQIGTSGNGVVFRGRSGGAAPTTSDLQSGEATVWRDTVGLTTKLYYNNGGVIQSVALA
jgi:hypothetical protein